ncbi:MAG TPA: response regulator transcription factor [Gemmatimonas sp.]|uniref:response regulator transcription factor n=1 Tax=Gemmatimonas sp. TaxID=1962908 RepID=UPI002ED81ACF
MPASLRVLVIEDNADLRACIVATFEAHGHRAEGVANGRLGLDRVDVVAPDVVVLDLTLPGPDGLRVCELLRARHADRIPVLMLTARDTLADKLRGFSVGADDYLVKPFAGEELVARCQALARRSARPSADGQTVQHIGSLVIDRQRRLASRQGTPLVVANIPWRILVTLADAWPRTVTRSELQDAVWPDGPPLSDALRSHLHVLRSALDHGFDRPMLITVHGVGFRLDERA